MRMLVLIGTLAALVLPASASEKRTVSELEQVFAQHASQIRQPAQKQSPASEEIADISDGNLLQQLDQDDELIPKINATELTERLSTLTMYRFVGKYNLGAHAQQALEQLADRAALLKLPPAEQLPDPPPEGEAQQRMLEESRAYVLRELSHLPSFVATQTTTRFDDSPVTLKYFQSTTDQAGFHRVGLMQRKITFKDGKEVAEGGVESDQANRKDGGLESRGEFGAEAATVLMDIDKGTIAFDHWEQSMGGLAAVYRYSVPRESSHYEVTGACKDHVSFHDLPAYSGELALQPKTGAILRLTLMAESQPGDPVSHVASVIEYGPIVLGNHRYLCPLRSLTFMNEEMNGCGAVNRKLQKPVMMINQTIFSNYHRFGSSTTLIFNEAQNGRTAPEGPHEKPVVGGEKTVPITAESGQPKRRP